MAKDTELNPALENENALEITQEIKAFVNDLNSDIQGEKTNRAIWETNIDRLRNLRYGFRLPKNHPWPNCANYVLNLADTHIQRLKPQYVNLAFAVTPIVTFEPFGPEDIEAARLKELLFDWRMKTQVKFFDQYNYGVDKVLQDGAAVFKVIWRFDTNTYTKKIDLNDLPEEVLKVLFDPRVTDAALFNIIQEELNVNLDFEENVKAIQKGVKAFRDGEEVIEFTLQEIKNNRPQVIARDLREDIIIPVETLIFEENIDDARFIDDRIWRSDNDVLRDMEDGRYEKYSREEVRGWIGKNNQDKKFATPTRSKNDDKILIHEVCCWYDIDGDGIKERCIATYPDPAPGMILRFIELPYDHNSWPYTLVKRELNDPTIYASRGIPALDEDYQTGITTAFNQAIDNGTIVNTPKVVYTRGSITNVRNARYIPGEPVETIGPTTNYEIRQQPNMSQGTLFQQAQFMKAWADQRVGDMTSGLSSRNNQAGSDQGGNRTAKEIQLIQTMQSGNQALDLQVFQQQMARVYRQIDALYDQFEDAEEYELIVNQKPTKISRQEIQCRCNILPNGRFDNSNPELRAQKNFELMKIFAQDPDVKQYELKKLFLQDYDARIGQRILMTEEEMAKRDAAMVQEQQAQAQSAEAKAMELREMKDAMDIKKEMALATVQGRKYAPDAPMPKPKANPKAKPKPGRKAL